MCLAQPLHQLCASPLQFHSPWQVAHLCAGMCVSVWCTAAALGSWVQSPHSGLALSRPDWRGSFYLASTAWDPVTPGLGAGLMRWTLLPHCWTASQREENHSASVSASAKCMKLNSIFFLKPFDLCMMWVVKQLGKNLTMTITLDLIYSSTFLA